MLIIGTTVFILVLLVISLIRILSVLLGEGVVGERSGESRVRSLGDGQSGSESPSPSFPIARPSEPERVPSYPRRRTSWAGNLLALLVIGLIGYGWWTGASLDKLVRQYALRYPKPSSAPVKAGGTDWTMVSGVRWFKVIGTDSSGIGYSGWVSECAFAPAPPVDDPETDDIFKKVGLPSMKERLEGAKRLRKINQSLKTAVEER